MSATISPQDRGLLLGDGVFDTMAIVQGVPQMFEAHVARLMHHAAAIHINVQRQEICTGMFVSIRRVAGLDRILRTTVTRGVTSRGLWPTNSDAPVILCHVSPFDHALIGAPASLIVSAIARNETSPTSRIKSLGYLDHVLAAREAHIAGADDAVFLNSQGAIACTTIGNVFVLEGDTLTTPPLDDGALDGIVRGLLLANPMEGLRVVEQTASLDRALNADAILVTNSVRLIRPVTRLNTCVFAPTPLHHALLKHIQTLLIADSHIDRPPL